MVIKTASPGVVYQEIDLTRGTPDAITSNVGIVAGPFLKGPVDKPTLVFNEVQLIDIFGNPTDENYEYWHSVNNFLEYSGQCYVVRVDDARGDAVDQSSGLGIHDQKMRNATDHFGYDSSEDESTDEIDRDETFSAIYLKNPDEYITEYGGLIPTQYNSQGKRIPGTGGTFIARTPGRHTNGLAVATIDAGADYLLTLKTKTPSISSDYFLQVNGGVSGSAFAAGISGGLAPDTTVGNDLISFPSRSGISFGSLKAGDSVAKYAKLIPADTDADGNDVKFINRTVTELSVEFGGTGFVDDNGNPSGTLSNVLVDGTGTADGYDLRVDLTIVNGGVVSAKPNYKDALVSPRGWEVGDTCATVSGKAVGDECQLSISQLSSQMVQIGNDDAVIIRAEYDNDAVIDDNGVVVTPATLLYYLIAFTPNSEGKYAEDWAQDSLQDIREPGGVVIGYSRYIWPLGEFVYYDRQGERQPSVIWEPQTWSRNKGISWFWPGRPNDGEKVYRGKSAEDSLGVAIESEDSPNPVTGAPVYEVATGPAAVTETSGDVITWDNVGSAWRQSYIPKEGDIIFDFSAANQPAPFNVLRQSDWYSQQIAFEGIPWRSFAPRPGTSFNARTMGVENDEVNVIVYDAIGDATGQRGSTIEQYSLASKLEGAKTVEGSNNYYKDLLNSNSNFIFSNEPLKVIGKEGNQYPTSGLNKGRVDVGTKISADTKVAYIQPRYGAIDFRDINSIADVENPVNDVPYLLYGAEDQLTASLGEIQAGYRKIVEDNLENVDYLIQGPAYDTMDVGESLNNTTDYAQKIAFAIAKANFLIALAEETRSCIACISPPKCASVDPINAGEITTKIIEYAERLSSSSYAILDSGYKYMYDRWRDKYAYTPLNTDIAGAMTQTSIVSQPFFSPAGLARGQIKNVVKLGFDPAKSQRDLLFTARCNPVVTFPGEGTVLYGDKTLLGYSSAFDRINVRRLFIYCEREIAAMSKQVLFEFNDVPTRVLFKNNVNPFMRDVQSKRGCIDFLIVCDSSNNTPDIIDRNEFVADIYIKPNRSINFVQLNFVATKTGVSFSEAVNAVRRNTANS